MTPEERFQVIVVSGFPPPPESPVIQYLKSEKNKILKAIRAEVRESKSLMRKNPALYKNDGDVDPSVDIRLCVDCDPFSWVIRTGSVDYDERHSALCAAGQITLTDTAEGLFEQLLKEI